MLQQENPDDYIIATGKTVKLSRFIEQVFTVLDLNWKEHIETSADFMRPTDIDSSIANPEKALKKLG